MNKVGGILDSDILPLQDFNVSINIIDGILPMADSQR